MNEVTAGTPVLLEICGQIEVFPGAIQGISEEIDAKLT